MVFCNVYNVGKDFAGPIATIVASFTAAYFVRRQWKTAEKQAETAVDQLRFNLHKQRYNIYEDVKNLIKILLNESHKQEFNAFDITPHYVVIDEAMFFFSPEICAWLYSVRADCQKFLEARTVADTAPGDDLACRLRLLEHLKAMPLKFHKELGFRQLARNE